MAYWKVTISQEYEYSYLDGTKSIGTHESTFKFEHFVEMTNFVELAIYNGAKKTCAHIDYVEGEENGI